MFGWPTKISFTPSSFGISVYTVFTVNTVRVKLYVMTFVKCTLRKELIKNVLCLEVYRSGIEIVEAVNANIIRKLNSSYNYPNTNIGMRRRRQYYGMYEVITSKTINCRRRSQREKNELLGRKIERGARTRQVRNEIEQAKWTISNISYAWSKMMYS